MLSVRLVIHKEIDEFDASILFFFLNNLFIILVYYCLYYTVEYKASKNIFFKINLKIIQFWFIFPQNLLNIRFM